VLTKKDIIFAPAFRDKHIITGKAKRSFKDLHTRL